MLLIVNSTDKQRKRIDYRRNHDCSTDFCNVKQQENNFLRCLHFHPCTLRNPLRYNNKKVVHSFIQHSDVPVYFSNYMYSFETIT
jgi:hypothetical protein